MIEKTLGEGTLKGRFIYAVTEDEGEIMHLINFHVTIGKGAALAGLPAGTDLLVTMGRAGTDQDYEVGYVKVFPPKGQTFSKCNRGELLDTTHRLERHLFKLDVRRALSA